MPIFRCFILSQDCILIIQWTYFSECLQNEKKIINEAITMHFVKAFLVYIPRMKKKHFPKQSIFTSFHLCHYLYTGRMQFNPHTLYDKAVIMFISKCVAHS